MEKKRASILGVLAVFLLVSSYAYGAAFDFISIRLDRQKVSQSNVRMLVVIEPSSATSSETETILRILFPNGFSVSSLPANITTSTSGLPFSYQGRNLTAMPGMVGTATVVSGQQVDFSIDNLTDGNYYAFYITSGINTPSSAGNYVTTVSTRSISSTIDSTQFGIDIGDDDQTAINATVPAKATDGELSISSSASEGTTFNENDVVTFTVNYRSLLETSQPFEIVASWEKGEIIGSGGSVLDVFDYVVSSATDTDDGTSPIIDIQNREITWSISSLAPSASSKSVSFQLKVKSNLATSSKMSVDVNINGTIMSTTLPQDTASFFVLKTAASTPTPSSTPSPTKTPTPAPTSATSITTSPTSTPTPTPTPQGPFIFNFIDTQEISDVSARIVFQTSHESVYTLDYGVGSSSLTERIRSTDYAVSTQALIDGLAPNTRYYFRATAENRRGERIRSDIYTFKTASAKESIAVKEATIFWKQLLLIKEDFVSDEIKTLIMPRFKPLVFNLEIEKPESVSEILVRIEPVQVLGINNIAPQPSLLETRLVEPFHGIFTGELLLPSEVGRYKVIMEVHDVFGGFYQKELQFNIIITEPVRVFNSNTKEPIENADVKVYIFEQSKKRYTLLEDAISYPNHTDENGELDIVLAPGKYKFDVTAIGYKSESREIEFFGADHMYPVFNLEPNNSVASLLAYYKTSFTDLGKFLLRFAEDFASSRRALDSVLLLSGPIILLLAFVTLSARLRVGFLSVPIFIIKEFQRFIQNITGKRTDVKLIRLFEGNNSHRAISGANVTIRNTKGKNIFTGETDILGRIHISGKIFKKSSYPLRIQAYREGYYGFPITVYEHVKEASKLDLIALRDEKNLNTIRGFFEWLENQATIFISDLLVIMTLLLTFIFVRVIGWVASLPFIIISLIVLGMWILAARYMWIGQNTPIYPFIRKKK